MYHFILAPIITYGLKTTAITKRNRDSLRKAEKRIVNILIRNSKDKPKNSFNEEMKKIGLTKLVDTKDRKPEIICF